MKLKSIHLFLIIILALVLCCGLGNSVVENLEDFKRISTVSAKNTGANYSTQPSLVTSKNDTITSSSDQGPPQAQVTETSYASPTENATDVYSTSNTQVVVTPNGQQVIADPTNTVHGVPKSQIPAGQEDLYILKSEIVPPVCPACPSTVSSCTPKCPPCPPPARCPEPAFDCKKVPNYKSSNTRWLPRPVLSDFSQFGM